MPGTKNTQVKADPKEQADPEVHVEETTDQTDDTTQTAVEERDKEDNQADNLHGLIGAPSRRMGLLSRPLRTTQVLRRCKRETQLHLSHCKYRRDKVKTMIDIWIMKAGVSILKWTHKKGS